MLPDLKDLLGPYGLTVALLLGITWLSRELIKFVREYITDIKTTRDIAIEGWKGQTQANEVLAKQAMIEIEEVRKQLLSNKRQVERPKGSTS